ncbi:hypothetical protein BHYA_0078g00040 [Botrytis hyacinthi]|uniref:Uncharacterized protein n=1 Tax=Botrytis hyacinthi TaxID=278943 RepID=A0A4Z1GS41_9HELO|nr:hypothetical protein BHYA_0078g00040 [Botrytis hyacinthi]
MCRHMTITYSCGCLTRSVEACPHSLSMKIAPEDCQFHFSEPIHRDEAQSEEARKHEIGRFSCSKPQVSTISISTTISSKILGKRVLKEQEKAKELDRSYQAPVRRESGEEGDDEETPRQSFSQPPTPREIESGHPTSESQRQRPVAEPRTASIEGEVEPFTPKKLVRKMSEGMKKMARRFSKKKIITKTLWYADSVSVCDD